MFRRAVEKGVVYTSSSIQIGMHQYSKSHLKEQRDLGHEVITALECREISIDAVIERADSRIGNSPVFLTVDIDFLDPAYASGTGMPEVGVSQTMKLFNFCGALVAGNLSVLILLKYCRTVIRKISLH